MKPTKEHWVAIRWGVDTDLSDGEMWYEFNSRAELEAFLDGIESAIGWLDYALVRESPAGGDPGFQETQD